MFKEEITLILSNQFQKVEEAETLSNLFYDVGITMTPKLKKEPPPPTPPKKKTIS